ncbi:E3 ubiquitin-protein ligase TRIM9-like, partial [Frankliniella occidentalis]|uniref:E3 ubiquitin-protein ligase TRIM9-like n=1 Tax=Frankliniella occidentalis TaxID=133901 RepID=A0A9C6XVM8_FRAOC
GEGGSSAVARTDPRLARAAQENCSELEAQVEAQVRALVLALEERRASLLEFVRADRDVRLRALREQVTQCTGKLQQTTGLIQFCIEALKETDPPAFLQVGSMLITRVANADLTWYKDVATQARISPHADLTLDDQSARRAITHLNFIQMKRESRGGASEGGRDRMAMIA